VEALGISGLLGLHKYPRSQGRGPERAKTLQNHAPVEAPAAA
jgi:hypothetical protein